MQSCQARLSTGYKQSLIVTIARLESTKIQLGRRFLHFGGDYTSTSNNTDNNVERSFVWREIDAALKYSLYELNYIILMYPRIDASNPNHFTSSR